MASGRQHEFFIFDVCSLKADPSFIGTVERSHNELNDDDPIDDCIIIAHSAIPTVHQNNYLNFLISGRPPSGYVLVAWADQERGRSLVAESDLHLVDRSYLIGDVVKRDSRDAMSGTVVNVSESYTVLPICSNGSSVMQEGDFSFNYPYQDSVRGDSPDPNPRLPDSISHPDPQHLLYNIPGEELTLAERFAEDDYVIHNNWLGVVTDCPAEEVTLLLEDHSVVVVWDALELEMPVPECGNAMVQIPEFHREQRPGINIKHQNGSQYQSFPPDRIQVGQELITSRRNIRTGNFLRGSYNSTLEPKGRVLGVRVLDIHVQWLCPNVFAPTVSKHPPSPALRTTYRPGPVLPEEGLSTKGLSTFDGMVLYDRRRPPCQLYPRSEGFPKCTGQDFDLGDRVRFRDLTAAALKYSGGHHGHGTFKQVPISKTYGFDVNELKIVCSQTEVTVQWQDQTITKEPATALRKLVVFEVEFSPGDVVSLKEKTEQVSTTRNEVTGFNEARFLEGDYDLRLHKLGIVQSVNSRERLAQVRWFTDPKVTLIRHGQVLRPGSKVGQISDEVDEVSLYEIMEHPALTKRRREIVLLPPERFAPKRLSDMMLAAPRHIGTSLLSFLEFDRPGKIFSYLSRLRNYMLSSVIELLPGTTTSDQEANSLIDWVGEIVDLGLDGSITVRLGGNTRCKDIKVPLERILMVIDEGAVMDGLDTGVEDGEWWLDGDSEGSVEPIEETVEYDGGQRLDQDSGDEMWETDEETPHNASEYESDDTDTETTESTDEEQSKQAPLGQPAIQQSSARSAGAVPGSEDSEQDLGFLDHEMPHFDVLEEMPPSDHHFITSRAYSSPALLRRLMREHKILSNSLPGEIYARTWQSRLDLLRVLIIGPLDTPYELAPFIIDFYFGTTFPREPPKAHFHSWTYGIGKINPNLYEEGKICLSLLGTWPGKNPDENWSDKASVLQILVSLMGLVLVKDPFYNEAGFEDFASEGSSRIEAAQYTEKAFVMARGFIKHALKNPIPGFDDVLEWLYYPLPKKAAADSDPYQAPDLLRQVIARAHVMINHHQRTTDGDVEMGDETDDHGKSKDASVFISRLSRGAVVMLRKHIMALEEIVARVESPAQTPVQQGGGRRMKLEMPTIG